MAEPLLSEISVPPQLLADYAQFGEEICDDLLTQAEELQGKRVLHINSTEKGGGVAELLKSQVGLEQGAGLKSRWAVIRPSAQFFAVTKKIHHFLQGAEGELSSSEIKTYEHESASLAGALARYLEENPADLLVVHDPQPLLAAAALAGPKVLRLHIDLCQPNPAIMTWLCQHVPSFNHAIISRRDCTLLCGSPENVTTIPPAIDPLTAKNNPLPPAEARPIVTQVSRFDQWKDPLGVIAAYRIAKKAVPDAQLVLIGFFQADDDADSAEYFKLVQAEAGADPDIHLFSALAQLKDTPNDIFINAFQVASDVILQKSIKEGFGLTVTEAMWKGKAVVGGDAGGIRLQIESGNNGLIVNTPAETGAALIQLLTDTVLQKKLGAAARASVQEQFLMPRFVRDNVLVYRRLLTSGIEPG
jgi:trehalose synthase